MTQSNEPSIEQMNEAIALFDGLIKYDNNQYRYPHFRDSKGSFVGYAHNLGYDTDWNKLMPVCHLIRSKALELKDNKTSKLLFAKLNAQLMYGTIADVYLKAYDYIIWYTNKSKPMSNKCNCQIPNTDLTGRCFKCGGTIETPADVQERIKADAQRFTKDEGYQRAYIVGATAENERAHVLVDALEECRHALSMCYNVIEHPADGDTQQDRAIVTADKALEQWKSGKPDNPCPHCGKYLSRDRNLCCRECGKEVGDA